MTPSDSLRAEDRFRVAAYTTSLFDSDSPAAEAGRVSPVPKPTLSTFRALYAGRFFAAALPSSSTASLAFAQFDGARLLLVPVARRQLTTRQASLDAADRGLAHLLCEALTRRFAGRVSPGGGRLLPRWLGPSLDGSHARWSIPALPDALNLAVSRFLEECVVIRRSRGFWRRPYGPEPQ